MSRKHNTKHNQRSTSKYPERLKKRGQTSASVRMPEVDSLRKRQDREGYFDSEDFLRATTEEDE